VTLVLRQRAWFQRALALLVVGLVGVEIAVFGQEATPPEPTDYFLRESRRRKPARTQARRTRRNAKSASKSGGARSEPRLQLLSGDVVVSVTDPLAAVTVNVALAKGGVGLIEFPAGDPIYTINPADESLVTIDRPEGRPMKNTDPVAFRPGTGFALSVAKGAEHPAAQITLQLTSGLVVVVNVFPVEDLFHSLTRLTVTYDRALVVAARREKGLSTDLNGQSPLPAPPPAVPVALEPISSISEVPYNPAAVRARTNVPSLVTAVQVGKGAPLLVAGKTPEEITHAELGRAMESPSKYLSKFSAATHGLQLAAGAARDVDANHKLVVFAVRNATKADIRLTPGQPDLFVETADGEGRPVNIEHLTKVRTETTAVERLVPASGIVYYAVLFVTPVLGARQQLRMSVSPMTAADEPATGAIPTFGKQ